MYYALNLKQAYNFVLRAPALLGTGYQNAVVMAIMDYDSAKVIQDVIPLHRAAYPYLETGTPRDPKDLLYIKLKTVSGEIRIVAMDWLAGEPVVVTTQTLKITLANVAVSDIAILKQVLIQNGFNEFEIESV